MFKAHWPLTLALALAAPMFLGSVRGASIRDNANMFSAEVVRKAEFELNRVERETKIPVLIETITSLNGESIADVSLEHARRETNSGFYILIAKNEHKIYDQVSRSIARGITKSRQNAIRAAFSSPFETGDFNAGLTRGVEMIGVELSAARAEQGSGVEAAAPQPFRGGVPVQRRNRQATHGLSSLLGIGLLIVGGLFVMRLLGALFRGGSQGYPGPGGRMMGGRPGYGGGGGGGGFMSSLFGGIGGAMAGNWLYDQFSGRQHGGYNDGSTLGGDSTAPSQGDDWTGGTGGGGDWGGGGDTGGGGDWGGGGGDTGGGDW